MFIAHAAFGKTKTEPKKTQVPTPAPTAEPKPKWIPPAPVGNDSKTFNATVAAHFSEDSSGILGFSFFDLAAIRKLDENDVTAKGIVRFMKPLSGSDGISAFELREANISLSEPWMEARLGRMDLSDLVSTTHFFGRYPLMGERRLDGIKFYLPFKFFFGVEDYKSVSSPPTSLSFFYFPTLMDSLNSRIDGSQSFFLGQARMKINLGDLRTVLLFNLGSSSSEYFAFSSLSGNLTYSICGEVNYAKDYSVYFEYGVQNASRSGDTNAFAFGARAEHIFTWEFFSIDQMTIEAQVPLGSNPGNPFTGGNGINPSLATTPQLVWYGKLRCRIRSVFIDFNITNSQNDFTLARLNSANINTPIPLPVGRGNETDGSEIPLAAKGYEARAFSVDVGVSF